MLYLYIVRVVLYCHVCRIVLIVMYVFVYSGKEERLWPIARSLNY